MTRLRNVVGVSGHSPQTGPPHGRRGPKILFPKKTEGDFGKEGSEFSREGEESESTVTRVVTQYVE